MKKRCEKAQKWCEIGGIEEFSLENQLKHIFSCIQSFFFIEDSEIEDHRTDFGQKIEDQINVRNRKNRGQ